MPQYDFRCKGCGVTAEEKRSMDKASMEGICPECGGITVRAWTEDKGFLFRAKGYRLRPGDVGYDSHFEVREAHTRQWEYTPRSQERIYKEDKGLMKPVEQKNV